MIDFKYPEGATPIDPDEAEGLPTSLSIQSTEDRPPIHIR